MSNEKYKEWIDKNYPAPQAALGQCGQACIKMKKDFPELTITNGLIFLLGFPEERLHWWCKDESNNIIDPTSHQYSGLGYMITEYQEIDESHPARNCKRAKCHNCGEHYYETPDLKYMHNKECENEYIKYINGDS